MNYEIRFTSGFPNVIAQTEESYERDEAVIVKVKETVHFGWINRKYTESGVVELSKDVLIERIAGLEDIKQKEKVREDSEQAKKGVLEIVNQTCSEMKVIEVAYAFDYSFLFISFTAENRVDFRQLLRELSGHFQTRIELRQIGVRDAAQLIGGIGPCGRPLCCAEFLYEFPTVSIKMVKTQQLGFNQGKINGICGRLMCCLSYENDFYKEAAQEFPDYGEIRVTTEGQGRVIGMNILKRRVTLRFPEFVREYELDELRNE